MKNKMKPNHYTYNELEERNLFKKINAIKRTLYLLETIFICFIFKQMFLFSDIENSIIYKKKKSNLSSLFDFHELF